MNRQTYMHKKISQDQADNIDLKKNYEMKFLRLVMCENWWNGMEITRNLGMIVHDVRRVRYKDSNV